MEKIISLFERDYKGNRQVLNKVVPGAEWVQAGEGHATRKWDGTCCLIRNGVLWKRYEVKKDKEQPPGFLAACEVDETTGKQQGWVLVDEDSPDDKWHREAWDTFQLYHHTFDGTFELCGPKVQGNPEGFDEHRLVIHGINDVANCPTDFEELREFLATQDIEGIVWHHPDGRMVKIKGKDFGIKRSKE